MGTLHRVQVYLEKEQIKKLKLVSEKERLPMAALIRMAVSRFLKAKEKSTNWDKDSLTLAVGKIKLNVSDASINHDHYLYGKKARLTYRKNLC